MHNAPPHPLAKPSAAPSALNLPPLGRFPLLLLGFVALIVGVGAGLARLGWTMPDISVASVTIHGPLMVCGFFGVVITLERAVAMARL